MSFYELAKERYSVRKFSDKAVEQEKLDKILEAGRLAPTAVNYQPQRIVVLTGDEVKRLEKCTHMVYGAPTVLIIGFDKNESWKDPQGKDNGDIDASIVATHIMFEAWEMGVGSVWTGHYDKAALVKEFNIPDYFEPTVIMPIGYVAKDAKPAPVHDKRKDIGETVFYGGFENMKSVESNVGKH